MRVLQNGQTHSNNSSDWLNVLDASDALARLCWLSDVHIDIVGILFKKQDSAKPMQPKIHW